MTTAINAFTQSNQARADQRQALEHSIVDSISMAIEHGDFDTIIPTDDYHPLIVTKIVRKLEYFGYTVIRYIGSIEIHWEEPK